MPPLFDKLDAEDIPYLPETKQFQTFFDLYIDVFEDEGSGASALIVGRIYTGKDIAQNATAINAAQRLTVEQPGGFTVSSGTLSAQVLLHLSLITLSTRSGATASSFSIASFTVATNATLAEKAEGQILVPNGAAYVNEVSGNHATLGNE
ncbi:hypothetical protein D9611_008427 [Ephemerocybe angulata]|uniref:Uncharacterized protein n=1 Tax=Ephemerocybe angulata TaxID=980116 RepID=A0A8H5F4Y2_9AGAR|nr:hypothetical protein D9611_008427 [Tulosesus angulatus]